MAAARKTKGPSAAPDVKLTNLHKVFFPETGFTKGDMVRYYIDVAPYILPHLHRRPVTLIRFPDGVTGEKFYEKNAPRFAPDWVKTHKVPRRREEGEINYLVIDDVRMLAWCANLAAIELHPFLHRVPGIDQPTHVAFDLDPGEGADLVTCIRVALLIRDMMDGLGLIIFPKVSGSKGLQLYLPLNTKTTYDATSAFAKAVAELLTQQHPDLVVSRMQKVLRRGRVLIDWSQNSRSKTTVAVYSLRGKREAPFVSMPVTWAELERVQRTKKIDTLYFAPKAALKRLAKVGDLFAPVLKLKQRLPRAFARQAVAAAVEVEADGATPDKTGKRKSAKQPKPAKSSQAGENKTAPALRAYQAKRDFTRTQEPKPVVGRRGGKASSGRFVIQKHDASRLHYDFRLEMDGTLKSWAVPKGVPTELGIKHAAIAVEDHPVSYMRFEGTIPKGQYGGGTVMVWDIGTYQLLSGSIGEGSLKLILKGRKLVGEWHMFKIRSDERDKDVWLIAKSGVAAKSISARRDDQSVLSRRSMARIAKDNDRQWHSRAAR